MKTPARHLLGLCAVLAVIAEGLSCGLNPQPEPPGAVMGAVGGSSGASGSSGSSGASGASGSSGASGASGSTAGSGGGVVVPGSGGSAGGGGGAYDVDASSGGIDGGGGPEAGADAGADSPPVNPCAEAGTCPTGVWMNVTPDNVDLTGALGCGNYGTTSMQADAMHPSHFYTMFNCQGVWKSTDYGATWKGPINTGTQGSVVGDCAGGISIPPGSASAQPTVYAACIRGAGLGFWRSTNGGVDWIRYDVGPGGPRQDFYAPAVDPYDANHLLMAGHEMNMLVESSDGGQNWTNVSLASGMNQNGGTAAIFFIDTGSATTTRTTFLWIAQQSDAYGTFRTTDGGATWKKVDKNEHAHGNSQIFQPDTGGVVFMAGVYSALGWGVLRSTDYGATWAHVGKTGNENVVFGTSKNVYAMQSWAMGLTATVDPNYELSPLPGTGTWSAPGTPAAMKQGAAQAAVTSDGAHNVIVTANWGAGLWRYIEP
jgi:hypothetical protein